jgi:hypothetical protein
VLRKGAHITEYAILGALLYRALEREALALAVGIAYAADRRVPPVLRARASCVAVDVAIDAVGLSLGMLVWLHVREPMKAVAVAPRSARRRRAALARLARRRGAPLPA